MTETPYLSIVIPAYNEQQRLPSYLEKIADYLAEKSFAAEVLVVDDGSDDATASIAEGFASRLTSLRVTRNPHRGKAAAVTTGILQARGTYVLFADADGATPIAEFDKLLPHLRNGYEIVIGSREGDEAQRFDEPWYRHAMGRIFNLIARLFAVRGVRDTQCGFKAFRSDAARAIFTQLKLYDPDGPPVKGAMVTAFDVEVLFLGQKMGYSLKSVPVNWYYSDQSKVNPMTDSFRNLRDVLRVRINDLQGKYDAHRQL